MKACNWGWIVCSAFIVSCNPMKSQSPSKLKGLGPEVIYGEDNRKDFYEIQDRHWQELGLSTTALVDFRDLMENPSNPNEYLLKSKTYGQRFRLCEEEKFFQQPSVSFCSGFLVGPQTVVTAGHCLRNEYNCETVRFIFDYKIDSVKSEASTIDKQNVFSCSKLIHTEVNAISGRDFAIVRLDRVVEDYPPLPLRSGGELRMDEELTVIGYPSGLPLKWADQGRLRNTLNPNFLITNLDTYGGNSGSAVFNSQSRLVEGILVRGETDFVYDQASQCRRSKVCLPDSCRGEDVVRISLIYEHLTPGDLMPLEQETSLFQEIK